MFFPVFSLLVALIPTLVLCVASTDSLQDADPAQSGYLPNHNLHPAIVGSSIFGQLWKNTYLPLEDWYAKPLVFTPAATGREVVFIASNQNVIRTIDGINGTLVNSRTIQPPFLQSDIGCGDIPNYIGITGTPIIDPTTETVYFFSKGYKGGASGGGVLAGQYAFYAVDFNTLQDKPGFPVIIDGNYANNDPTRYFLGGTVLQRPSLTSLNGVVIGAFGGHCDLFNYTGMLVAVSKTPGVGVTSIYAMESSPGAPTPQPLDYRVENGGKAGIWQSGMGLATDISRIFLATGNGQGHQNGAVPSSGRVPLSTLDETVANFQVSASGTLSLTDYFEPFEYVNMDAADRDLGSGGVVLLDPTVFAAPNVGISRIALSVGKNGKCYILDANSLGGFRQGPQGTDGILQTITAANAVFGGSGSYPLEGGYIYFTPVGYPTVAYKFSLDSTGNPYFVLSGQAAIPSAGRVGVGLPTVTTYKGQAGTGILWVTDVNLGLRAFKPVPENGVLVQLPLPATPGLGKFQRPGFGNGRVFITTRSTVYCLGSPVALPLSCTQPIDFGGVSIGSTATVSITCIAQIPINKVTGCTTQDKTFQCLNSSLPVGPLAKGASFTFPVVWNLTQSSINDAQNVSFGHVLPGVQSTVLDLYTQNGVTGYSTDLPLSIGGTTISQTPFLVISPQEVDFGGIVVGSPTAESGLSGAVIISNLGSQVLVFTGFAWDDGTESDIYNNLTTSSDGSSIVGGGFTAVSFPDVGDTIAAGTSITIPLKFKTNNVGSYSSILTIWSNGGSQYILLAGSASTNPIANISVSTIEGGWDYEVPVLMDFGNVLAGTTVVENIRLCNSGGSPMTVTKSKPPTQPELTASNPTIDLHEGQSIPINACALGPVKIIAAFQGPNRPAHVVSDVWTLNCDGLNSDGSDFGVHDVAITATITANQVGVLLPNGTARYQYLGCYADGSGRQLATKLSYNNSQQAANENGQCQRDCFAKGYIFAGTEYHIECWCGNKPPSAAKLTPDSAKKCAFSCPGDAMQACGGTGTYVSIYYDTLMYTPPGSGSAPSSSTVISSTVSSSPVRVSSSSSSSFSTASPSVATSTPSSISSSSTRSLSITTSILGSSSNSSSISSSIATTTLSSSPTFLTISSSPPRSTLASSSSSLTISSTIITSTLSSTSSTRIPTSTGLGSFSYVGCYADPPTGRALKMTLSSVNMTNELCAQKCAGFTYFGTEYAKECYCGNVLAQGTAPAPVIDCKLACTGNKSQICGGNLRLSLYSNTTSGGVGSSLTGLAVRTTSSSAVVARFPSPSSASVMISANAATSTTLSLSYLTTISTTSDSSTGSSPYSSDSSKFSGISAFNSTTATVYSSPSSVISDSVSTTLTDGLPFR